MCVQNLKFVALPIPETGGTPKIWAVSGYAHSPFSPKFLMGFCFSKISNLCGPDPPTSQKDGQTDRQTDYSASRSKNCKDKTH